MKPTTLLPAALLFALAACAPANENEDVLLVLPAADGELDAPDVDLATYGGTFTTIQGAINAASPGQTVSVPSGTYVENITIPSQITVLGAGRGETFIVGTVTISSAANAQLRRVTLYDPTYYSGGNAYQNNGVTVSGGSSVVLDDVSAYYFNRAILLNGVSGATVSEPALGYNRYGIEVNGSSNVLIANGLIVSNSYGGIASYGGSTGWYFHNTLVGNAFGGTSNYLTGAISLGTGGGELIGNNNMTGNYYGLNCYGCTATWGYNNVWGNTTDFVNDAYARTGDMSVDPRFIDAANNVYGLTSGSPLIDAGLATYGVNQDFDATARPQGAGYDIGADEYSSSAYDLVISEVMANPRNETTGEFVEIHNRGTGDVDLAGFVLSDGDDTDVLRAFNNGGTVLPAGGYAVIVDSEYNNDYNIPSTATVLTIGDVRLGNGMTTSDPVTLYEPDGSTIAATFSFPTDPGDGVSMEMNDLVDGDVTGNWRASACTTGSSPGEAHCFPPSGDPTGLIITEVMANPVVEDSGEYIELFNPTNLEIDAAGLRLSDGDSMDTLVGFQGRGTLVGPGQHAVIVDPDFTYGYYLPADIVLLTTTDATLGNGLSNGTDPVTLYLADGTTVIDAYTHLVRTADGVSVEKVDYAAGDTTSNWLAGASSCLRAASPGRLNGASGGICDPIVITEVMANPLDEGTGEFIELYNAGWDTVDLAGLVIDDGSQSDTLTSFGGVNGTDSLLPPGGWAVILDRNYASDYTLPSNVVLMTTGDSNLGNGLSVSDTLVLKEADGASQIDSYMFPSNPGNGVSVERTVWSGALDAAEHWLASTCASGSSPGASNCVSSASTGTTESSIDLLITEVMANPLDENTGEFVEIYNSGTVAVDLLYGVIFDGDAVDTILGFSDPFNTVLQPGAYAVILDANYNNDYTIPSSALLLTTDDTTIGSGLAVTSDPVYFFEGNATALIDSYTHPFNPGNGVSVERVDYSSGDVTSNWAASGCTASPGAPNCQ